MSAGNRKRIEIVDNGKGSGYIGQEAFAIILSNLAIAESNLHKKGSQTAQSHFIAIVKKLEIMCGFTFQEIPE